MGRTFSLAACAALTKPKSQPVDERRFVLRRWAIWTVGYYLAFEAFAPFAILFDGGWPRVAEGVGFAVIASTAHAWLGRRVLAVILFSFAVYSMSISVSVGVSGVHGRVTPWAAALIGAVGAIAAALSVRIWRRSGRPSDQ